MSIRDGGILKDGYHADVGRTSQSKSRRQKLDRQPGNQRTHLRTGIESLKVRYNQVFGYYQRLRKRTWERFRLTTFENRRSSMRNDS